MRTIGQIRIAVQEADPTLTDEELRLCIEAMRTQRHYITTAARALATAVLGNSPALARLRAGELNKLLDRMFEVDKKPPTDWLGADNIPGTEAYRKRLQQCKQIFKAATGLDL